MSHPDYLQQELILPNGTRISNRIAKSAMSENDSTKTHEPSPNLIKAYKKWGQGGAGLLITGNIMVDSSALGEPRNVVVENDRSLHLLKAWADTVKNTQSHLWAQINHPGRQAMEPINNELMAPSAIPLKYGEERKLLPQFQKN